MQDLLILDTISGVPMAKELYEAFVQNGVNVTYTDLCKFSSKILYTTRATYHKVLKKSGQSDSFYHFPKIQEKLFENFIIAKNPQYVLVVGFIYKLLSPTFLLKMKHQLGFVLYLYDTDCWNLYSKRREFIFFIENELIIYNCIFSFSQVTTNFFRHTRNLPAEFLPFGAKLLPPANLSSQTSDVLFVGSADLRRILLLEHIAGKVTVFGNRWNRNLPLISNALKQRVQDYDIWNETLLQELHRHKIVLNITRSPFYSAETGVNLRIFESLSAGCFLLTDYCDELSSMFEIGKEIEMFRSANELVEKVNYYLDNPEKRIAIAKHGRERFLQKYTWNECARRIAEYLHL